MNRTRHEGRYKAPIGCGEFDTAIYKRFHGLVPFLPVVFVVLGMGQKFADAHSPPARVLRREMDGCDKTVGSDIEDINIAAAAQADSIGGIKSAAYIGEIAPFGISDGREP